jgi:hypothetical protein
MNVGDLALALDIDAIRPTRRRGSTDPLFHLRLGSPPDPSRLIIIE